MIAQFSLLAILALISSSTAQWQQQLNGRSSGNCKCPQEYRPFCGTDGRRETTYSSKCQLECAQRSTPGLRVKFEGVCAVPYKQSQRESKNWGSSDQWKSGSSIQPTYRPFSPSYPVPTTRRTYTSSYGVQTTRRPYSASYPVTTRRPTSYGQPTTNQPWWHSSQTQQSRYPSSSYNNKGYNREARQSVYTPIVDEENNDNVVDNDSEEDINY